MKKNDFVSELQRQAKRQSRLHERRLLPSQVDWLTSIVGNYPWQVIFVLALVGALLWSFL
jgi:hypothetical protein